MRPAGELREEDRPISAHAISARRRYRWLAPTFRLPDVLASLRREAVARLELNAGDTVLDLGCGAGRSFELLQERVGPAGRIVGLDVSPHLLAVAAERVARRGWKNVDLIETEAGSLLSLGDFDAILCFCTHDVLQSPEALPRATLALGHGGRLVAAGLKLSRRLPGALLDPLVGLLSLPYVTSMRNAFAPWSLVANLLPVSVDERWGGLGYIAVAQQATDFKRQARDWMRGLGPTSAWDPEPPPLGLWRGDGTPIHPGDACIPILQELEPGRLKVVGTGFWIARYGLFLTAKHVLEELIVPGSPARLARGYVLHLGEGNEVHLRIIRAISLSTTSDLAIGQANNYMDTVPHAPMQNLRGELSMQVPPINEPLVAYAYPENAILDFIDPEGSRSIHGDYFKGKMLEYVTESEHPYIRHPYYETSVEIRAGASGCPVFDGLGRVIGVSCRGWDFRGAEHEGDPLSYLTPVGELLGLEVDLLQVPPGSWEDQQLPPGRTSNQFTVLELGRLGHVLIGPDLEEFARGTRDERSQSSASSD